MVHFNTDYISQDIEEERIPENIAKLYEGLEGRSQRRAIFKHYRNIDDSHLWPIKRSFNATERAIRRLYAFEHESGYYLLGLELCYFLDEEISRIVNAEV